MLSMISGLVDDYGRALISITIFHPPSATSNTVQAWIDSLPLSSVLPGAVADGSKVLFETYSCEVEWFGQRRAVEAIAGAGQFALVGIGLLEDCTLVVNYPEQRVRLTTMADTSDGAA
jgi:hypothetical protein